MGFMDIFKTYTKNPLKDSLKVLEADIYHANTLLVNKKTRKRKQATRRELEYLLFIH